MYICVTSKKFDILAIKINVYDNIFENRKRIAYSYFALTFPRKLRILTYRFLDLGLKTTGEREDREMGEKGKWDRKGNGSERGNRERQAMKGVGKGGGT